MSESPDLIGTVKPSLLRYQAERGKSGIRAMRELKIGTEEEVRAEVKGNTTVLVEKIEKDKSYARAFERLLEVVTKQIIDSDNPGVKEDMAFNTALWLKQGGDGLDPIHPDLDPQCWDTAVHWVDPHSEKQNFAHYTRTISIRDRKAIAPGAVLDNTAVLVGLGACERLVEILKKFPYCSYAYDPKNPQDIAQLIECAPHLDSEYVTDRVREFLMRAMEDPEIKKRILKNWPPGCDRIMDKWPSNLTSTSAEFDSEPRKLSFPNLSKTGKIAFPKGEL